MKAKWRLKIVLLFGLIAPLLANAVQPVSINLQVQGPGAATFGSPAPWLEGQLLTAFLLIWFSIRSTFSV